MIDFRTNSIIRDFVKFIKLKYPIKFFELEVRYDSLFLINLTVKYENYGMGTSVMNHLIKLSKVLKMDILLNPQSENEKDIIRLYEFYYRLGFEKNKDLKKGILIYKFNKKR